MNVELGTFHMDFDAAPLVKGLPDDMSLTPAWGCVLKGSVRVKYKDREKITNAGDVVYTEPLHAMRFKAGMEYVAFSPAEEFDRVISIIDRNAAKR